MATVGGHPIRVWDPSEPRPALHSQYPTCLQSVLPLPSFLNWEDTATSECVTEGVFWNTELPVLTVQQVPNEGSVRDSSRFPLSQFQQLPTFHSLNSLTNPPEAHFPHNL